MIVDEGYALWPWFTRLFGCIALLAIGQLYHQLMPLIGSRGVTPLHRILDRLRVDSLPPQQAAKKTLPWRCRAAAAVRRFCECPTMFWLVGCSDAAILNTCLVGTAAAACIVVGVYTRVAFVVCYACYLSLDAAGALGLAFPWDCLMMETLTLGALLPPLQPLWQVLSAEPPLPPPPPSLLVVFAFRLLVFRLLFGFGS
jgi:hypothetical protein